MIAQEGGHARSRTGEAVGEAGKSPSARRKLHRFIRDADALTATFKRFDDRPATIANRVARFL